MPLNLKKRILIDQASFWELQICLIIYLRLLISVHGYNYEAAADGTLHINI